MRDKLVFGAVAIAVSAGLYLALTSMSTNGVVLSFNRVSLLIPACAIMVAAQGVSWRRRMAFASVTLVGCLLIEALPALAGLPVFGDRVLSPDASQFQLATVFAYTTLRVVFPVAALVVFVGRRPAVLWTRSSADCASGANG